MEMHRNTCKTEISGRGCALPFSDIGDASVLCS